MSAESISPGGLRLDPDGIPILDEAIDERLLDDLVADLKAQLLTELEPMLQELVRGAFNRSVRLVALDLKHTFERELDRRIEERLRALVEDGVERACRERWEPLS
jgi:hypothetical protein